jgi:tight adherence protein B
MNFALATFGIALAVMLGAYWFFVVLPETKEKTSVMSRIRAFKPKAAATSVASDPQRLSDIPLLDSLLRERGWLTGRVQRLLVEADVKMTVGAFLLTILCAGAVGWSLGFFVIGFLVAGVLLAALLAALPYLYVKRKRTVRLNTFEEQFPEAIDLISRALRAGHAFTTGLSMVADEIPAPVGAEFRRLYDEQNFGMSLPVAMKNMATRVPVLDAKFFVTAVLTQRESGGNLSEVLDNLASVMRERFKLRRQIRVISAHGRISAWVLSCLPPALAGVLFLMSPNFMRVLIDDPIGVRLIMIAVCLEITGAYIISRLVKIEY